MEPFKNKLNAAVVDDMAVRLKAAWPEFDRRAFKTLATRGLDSLELKARAQHIGAALDRVLPPDFARTAPILTAAIVDGMEGWSLWPVGDYVSRHGLATPEIALDVLHSLTQKFTAEWAIRPFILEHPRLTFATLARWVDDPSEHVRRLVSEGSRPRLPWGLQLKPLVADPSPTLPLLEALMDDESEYVRKSVANHLNDIAKDHPHLVADWLDKHLPGASRERHALLRHASRSLIKNGDARVLTAFGHGGRFRGRVELSVAPERIEQGESIELNVHLHPAGKKAQALVIDYAIHHVKANGQTSPKVFKGWNLNLAAGAPRALRKSHTVKPITTRRYFPGTHLIELLVNGRVEAKARFDLRC